MEPRTQEHLTRAEHHRHVAQLLVSPQIAELSPESPADWAVVAAFYAAVHYVNAWLWETRQFRAGTHADRTAAVRAEPPLRPAAPAYRTLQDLAYQARYAYRFQPTPQVLTHAVQMDLATVRRVVRQALSLPP